MADALQTTPQPTSQVLGATPAVANGTSDSLVANASNPTLPAVNPTPQSYQAMMSAVNSTPNQVFSANNIQQAQNNPAPKIDTSDPLGVIAAVNGEYNIPALQQQATDAANAVMQFDQKVNTFNDQIGNQTVGMNVIRGEQATMNEQAQRERQGLVNAATLVQNQLAAQQALANQAINVRMTQWQNRQSLMMQYPDAGIKFGDSDKKVAEKIGKAQKNTAIQNLYLQTFGNMPKGMSTKDMNKELKKYFDDDKAYNKQLKDLQLKQAKATLAGTGKASDKEIQTANENGLIQSFSLLKDKEKARGDNGWDGYTNPADWKPLLSKWVSAGGSAVDFLKLAKDNNFINPNDI